MKKVLALVLALVLVLSLVACGGSSGSETSKNSPVSKNSIVGKWALSSSDLSKIENHNNKIPSPEKIDNNGDIEFFEDGSCNATIYNCEIYHSDSSIINYVYKYKFSSYYTKDNGKLYLSIDGSKYSAYDYTISDNQLLITMDVPNSSYEALLEHLTYIRVE